MNALITVISIVATVAYLHCLTKEQNFKNAKKGYGKKDLKELMDKGFFDKKFMKN